jgi:hypothetical protein
VHHFGNTLFMTVGSKIEIFAVFPRLRDTLPGRKESAIPLKYLEAWYDKVVRPSAIEVFGEGIRAHWPLSYSNHIWKDRQFGRLLHPRFGVAGNRNTPDEQAMTTFLRAIHRVTGQSNDQDVSMLHGVRFLIQIQNEKLQFRENVLFNEEESRVDTLQNAVKKVVHDCFQTWKKPLPEDTHIDLATEMYSNSREWAPYPKMESHKEILKWYLNMDEEQASRITSPFTRTGSKRGSEHTEYKIYRVAGLKSLACMNFKTSRELISKVREAKAYVTGKGYTYSRSSKHGIQQPAPYTWLSENHSIKTFFSEAQKTLQEAAASGANGIRIELTLPVKEAIAKVVILPSPEIIARFAKVESGSIW